MKTSWKRILKIGIPIALLGSFTTLIICVSGILSTTPILNIGGSTAVLPLITKLSNSYDQIDIVTSAGGSGAGINSIINGTKEIGMASKNPGIKFNDKDDKRTKIWEDKKIKTLTIAWDGMAIIYKPKNNNTKIDINEESYGQLLACFSGIKEFSFKDLNNKNNEETIIKPFARNGGSNISGTADAFLKDSHLDYEDKNTYWGKLSKEEQEKIYEILENGSYGSNVVQTAEANSQAWNRIKNESPGSMIYLSAGFVLNNKEEIEKNGFKIATYKGIELGSNPKENNIAKNGYNWFRPFNLIYSIDQIKGKKHIEDFLKWIFNEKEGTAKKIIENEGYISLTIEQIKTMKAKPDLVDENWIIDLANSDVKLGYCGAKSN